MFYRRPVWIALRARPRDSDNIRVRNFLMRRPHVCVCAHQVKNSFPAGTRLVCPHIPRDRSGENFSDAAPSMGSRTNRKGPRIHADLLIPMVAGAGFEPATFGL